MKAAWTMVKCETCGAPAGKLCRTRAVSGTTINGTEYCSWMNDTHHPHVARVDAGKAAAARRGRNTNGRRKTK